MEVTPQDIEGWIEEELEDSIVTADGDGHHFEAVIVCAGFEGQSTMQRHRQVYAALGERMKSQIHALSIKTHTPEQWDALTNSEEK